MRAGACRVEPQPRPRLLVLGAQACHQFGGRDHALDRADALAKLQTLWGDAGVVNQIPGWIQAVDAADVQRAARTYLTTANRTVIDRKPAAMLAPAEQK